MRAATIDGAEETPLCDDDILGALYGAETPPGPKSIYLRIEGSAGRIAFRNWPAGLHGKPDANVTLDAGSGMRRGGALACANSRVMRSSSAACQSWCGSCFLVVIGYANLWTWTMLACPRAVSRDGAAHAVYSAPAGDAGYSCFSRLSSDCRLDVPSNERHGFEYVMDGVH